jgi:3-oxoacyl-[acyl-carrier-protein] synthase II
MISSKSLRRVVITGLGLVNPLGNNVPETWSGLCRGVSGIDWIPEILDTDYPVRFAGQVKNFDPEHYFSAKDAKKYDPFVWYGLAAALEAFNDSGLAQSAVSKDMIGCCVGSGIGGISTLHKQAHILKEKGPKRVSPFLIPTAIPNMAAGIISMHLGLMGPNLAISTACATGAHNIGIAARLIASGEADAMLAGGTEAASDSLGMAGFAAMKALSTSTSPAQASCPWDMHRDGFVLSDGAGVLVLEALDLAKARGAKIYGEWVGFGMSSDAHHVTAPHPEGLGAILAMQKAIKDAGILAQDIQYLNAHGTSTFLGDLVEAKAIEHVFSKAIDHLWVTSTKSMTGHLLGAAGAVEAIFTILSLYHQVIPPTINIKQQDALIALRLVKDKALQTSIDYAMSNSFAFGGTNAALVFKKYS